MIIPSSYRPNPQALAGAKFWVFLSPENATATLLTEWSVTISQGDWSDTISADCPDKQIHAIGRCGLFDVSVSYIDESQMPPRRVAVPPMSLNSNILACSLRGASMIGLVARPAGMRGHILPQFWTSWDGRYGQDGSTQSGDGVREPVLAMR